MKNSGILVKLLSTAAMALVGLLILSVVALGQIKQGMLDDRMTRVKVLSEVALGVVQSFYDRAKAGEFDEATAKVQAAETLRRIRYAGADYFFIYDFSGTCVMLPPATASEGKNFIDLKDSDGVPFIRHLVEAGKAGGGPVFYRFPRAGTDIASPKASYATGFAPWGWMVGTGIYMDDIDAEYRDAAWKFTAIAGLVVLVVLALVLLQARSIARPVAALADVAQHLARGDYHVEVGDTGRKDEIGALIRSISVLRDEAAQAADARAKQQEAYHRAAATRRDARLKLANDVEATIKRVADVLVEAVGEMEGAARTVSSAAQNASDQASEAVGTSEQASTNVSTVATAAEELSASIHEISAQVQKSSAMSGQAVQEAERTNTLVQGLSEATGRIGEVVTLINDIASQTNLLALNATIEAARAGDAGKGFAVVAGEVKTLANQTAKATGEISSQVATVQERTRQAVEAIRGIGTTIATLNEVAAAIAAAVEEQGAATAEIARNVQEASDGTQAVTQVLGQLSQTTAEAGGSADAVLTIAGRLTAEANSLESEIHNFMGAVRADQGSGN